MAKETKEQREAKARKAEETLLEVWKLRQPPYNLPQAQIAAQLGITQSGVSRALQRARKLYGAKLDKGKEQIAADIQETVDRLEYLFYEATQAWERSKKPIRETAIEKNVPIIIGGKVLYDEINNRTEAEADETGIEPDHQKVGLKMTASGLKTVGYFDKVKVTKIKRDGNHNYLFGAIQVLRELSELKGIKAPQKTALTDPTGEKEAGIDVGLSDKETANRLLSILNKAKRRKEHGKE